MSQFDTPSMEDDEYCNQATLPLSQTLIWGRLTPLRSFFRAKELVKEEYSCGRNTDSDIVLDRNNLGTDLTGMSKQHFELQRRDGVTFLLDKSRNGTFVNGAKVGLRGPTILVTGDVIAIGQVRLKLFKYEEISPKSNIAPSSISPPEYIQSNVSLGSGTFGQVSLVYEKRTGAKFALKKVPKLTPAMQNKYWNEVRVMQELKHPCIVELIKVIDGKYDLLMVLEYMAGGDLLRYVTLNKRCEADMRIVFVQIALALQYLHGKRITHRDLKPSNVLLMHLGGLRVKLSDFGLSKLVDGSTSAQTTVCGTPAYIAPEVHASNGCCPYTEKVDVWSYGVMLFFCLSRRLPFEANGNAVSGGSHSHSYSFEDAVWSGVTQEAKGVVRACLLVEPTARPDAADLLRHPWFQDQEAVDMKANLMANGRQS